MADDQSVETPQSERVVDFYGDAIPVAQLESGDLLVPLRPLADFLGLEQSAQYRRIQRDEVLSKRVRRVMMRGASGRMREQLCLPLDLLPGWLFGVTTARVQPDLRDKLNRYREECFRTLWNAFKGDILPYAPVQPSTNLTTAEQNLEIAAVVYHLAQQQVEAESRLANVENKQETIATYMRNFIQDTRNRLTSLEIAT